MEKELRKQLSMIARMLEMELNKQKPFKDRVRVTPKVSGDKIEFVYYFPSFGRYLDLGTEQYRVSEMDRGPFNRSPGKGKGGIKPRFWMSINDTTKTRITMLLKTIVTRIINEELIKAFKAKK
jgi:hypothetical protein